MTVREKLSNVSSYATTSEHLGIISNDLFFLYCRNGLIDIKKPQVSRGIFSVNDVFYVSDIEATKTYIYSIDGQLTVVDYMMTLPFSIKERQTSLYIYPIIRNPKIGKAIGKVCKKSYKLEEVYPIDIGLNGVWKVINDSCFLSKTESDIAINTFVNNERLWQFKLGDLMKGKDIKQYGEILIIDECLYLYLSDDKDSKNTATVSVNFNTGHIESMFANFGGKLTQYQGTLYVANSFTIKTLNLLSKEVKEYDLRKTLAKSNLQIHWNTYKIADDKLFFVDGHSVTSNRLGIVDLTSMELIWEKEIKVDDDINNNIQEIRVSNDKLFVHCSDQSLHIFEQDNK
jgi:hypothetical protein